MVDLTQENYLTNARLLLHGFWYAELPDLLDINSLEESIEDIFDEIDMILIYLLLFFCCC